MILRFAAENFRSLRDRNEISFIASALTDTKTGLLTVPTLVDKVLPAIAIYGPNASGKSNLLSALAYVQSVIRYSHRDANEEGQGTGRIPFLLDPSFRDKVSHFDIDVVIDNVRYHYGFECNDTEFTSEWLYAFPKRKRQVWFYRTGQDFDFGTNLTGRNKVAQEQTGKNTLFLSAAAAAKHESLLPIYQFIQRGIQMEFGGDPSRIETYLTDKHAKSVIMGLLSSADFGISTAEVEEPKDDEKTRSISKDLTEVLRRHFPVLIESGGVDLLKKRKTVRLGHDAKNGEVVYLPDGEESQGTLRLLGLLGPVMKALATGSILVIDEIDSSLHSAVSGALIRLFSRKSTNKLQAQLLFSTHDTNLLCGGALRRDQIWFTEKANDGASVVYPLTDIATRKGDNLERGYLQGRYGAMPFIGDWEALLNDAELTGGKIEILTAGAL